MVPSLPKVLVQHEMTRHLEATKFNLAKACLQGRIFTRQKVTHYWNLLLFGWRISHQAFHLDFSRKFPSPERIFLYTVKDNQRNDYPLAVSNYWTFWVVKPFFPHFVSPVKQHLRDIWFKEPPWRCGTQNCYTLQLPACRQVAPIGVHS